MPCGGLRQRLGFRIGLSLREGEERASEAENAAKRLDYRGKCGRKASRRGRSPLICLSFAARRDGAHVCRWAKKEQIMIGVYVVFIGFRSEEHTSEFQSRQYLVC